MKLALVALSIAAGAAIVAAISDHVTPFNVKLYDSHFPERLARDLTGHDNGKNASEKSYERLYIKPIDPRDTHEYDVAAMPDAEFICELNPSEVLAQKKDLQPPEDLAVESPADILRNAMLLIHAALPHGSCLWAYELRGTYWTYALCGGDKVVQYHESAPPAERKTRHIPLNPSVVFVLGRFSAASNGEVRLQNQASESVFHAYAQVAGRSAVLVDEKPAPYSHQRAQKAVLQTITDGSVCDMTLQPRTAEIVYRCAENGGSSAAILDVFEMKTCHYKMFVHVPELCEYAPFSLDKTTVDAALDVSCQRVSELRDSQEGVLRFTDFKENFNFREDSPFPVRADHRLDVADHHLVALGRGFYFARSRRVLKTRSAYVNERIVVLFSGVYKSLADLNEQFAKVIFHTVGNSLLAPGPSDANPITLEWLHSFILWYEIYDYTGAFLGVTRIVHDASENKVSLKAQLLDPIMLLDVEGGVPQIASFERPEFQAPHDAWNFEFFSDQGAALPRTLRVQPEKSMEKTTGHLRQIMAYNRGLLEDARVDIELVDMTTGKKLIGLYGENGDYFFEIENDAGGTDRLSVKPMNPELDFMGFTVSVLSGASTEKVLLLENHEKVYSYFDQETHKHDDFNAKQQVMNAGLVADDVDNTKKQNEIMLQATVSAGGDQNDIRVNKDARTEDDTTYEYSNPELAVETDREIDEL